MVMGMKDVRRKARDCELTFYELHTSLQSAFYGSDGISGTLQFFYIYVKSSKVNLLLILAAVCR